jgi:tripartite-type tricarboxylate transporter receptor subunit TctC
MKKIMLTLLTLVLSFNVYSQTLIDKQPVKIIVPIGAGGGIDTIARIIGRNLSEIIKVPVIVENKPGANGVTAGKSIVNEESNGKTLLFYAPHSYTLNNLYAESANQIFEWDKDLTPISMIYWSPFILVVNKKMNVNNLSELKEKFKNKDISFASSGTGTPLHIYSEIIFNKLEMKSIHVPYKGLPAAVNDVLGENVDAIATGPLTLVPQIKAGNLTPLLILSDKVNPEFPNVPTMSGIFSEYSNLKIVGSFLLNKNTDPAIKEKLRKDIELATKNSMEELKQKNFVDASESIVYDDRKMKQIEKNWITAVEKIKSTQQLPKKH